MKAVVLAGDYGMRLSEETGVNPKPMVEIGGHPVLRHIMKIYSAHAINEFIICCGYKGHVIKEYFANYFLRNSGVTFDTQRNSLSIHRTHSEPWKVTLVDTGEGTMTGGRLNRDIPKDQVLTYDDVEVPEGRLCNALREEQNAYFGPAIAVG